MEVKSNRYCDVLLRVNFRNVANGTNANQAAPSLRSRSFPKTIHRAIHSHYTFKHTWRKWGAVNFRNLLRR
jgi:hypothetical protein